MTTRRALLAGAGFAALAAGAAGVGAVAFGAQGPAVSEASEARRWAGASEEEAGVTAAPGPLEASGAPAARPAPEAAPAPPQERSFSGNVPYDGNFTFTRIRFETSLPGRGGGFFRSRDAPWAHDYPRAERNFMRILHETTALEPDLKASNVFTTDDPELFRYPVAYLVEPGFWNPSEAEVEGLRAWLLKGGFLIVDDFRGGDWRNFSRQMRRILPDAELRELDVSHPVFQSFFRIEALDLAPPTFRQFEPAYYGIFEDDDPDERLMVVANYNNDIGDYWEWSDVGYVPIDLSNEAYKLGVNYIIYGMTH